MNYHPPAAAFSSPHPPVAAGAVGSADQSVVPAPVGSADQSKAKRNVSWMRVLQKGACTFSLCGESRVDTARWRRGRIPLRHFTLLYSERSGLCLSFLLLLPLHFLGVSVEEHIDHDIPAVRCARDGASESENFTSEEPPHETNGMTRLVVGGDCDIDKLQ